MRGFGEKLKSKNKGKKVEKVIYAVIKSLAGKIWKIEGIEIGRRFRCPRANRDRYTILFRYMALPGPPEIAWPPSKMVVGWTCKRGAAVALVRIGRASVFRSAASTRSSLTTPRACRSLVSVCFSRTIPERARPASWPGRISYTWPRLLVAPLSLSRVSNLAGCPTRPSRMLTLVSSIVAFPLRSPQLFGSIVRCLSEARRKRRRIFSPIPYVDLFKFLFIKSHN